MSPRTGKRRTVAPGIYQDAKGYEAVVKHRKQRRSIRFPLATPLATMLAWQVRQRALIDLGKPRDKAETTLAQDIARYLALLPAGRTRDDAEDLLAHWGRLYGDQPRSSLTAPVIHGQLLAWLRDGAAAQTCNHRRRVLVTLTKTLDGPQAENHAKDCPKLPVPRPEPRGLPWATIEAILLAMRPCATKTRLLVQAHTGWPQATLERLQPGDLRLTGRTPYVVLRPRQKGEGAPAAAVPVTRAAVAALKRFAAEKLWGEYSHSSVYKSFRLAAKKAGVDGVRPYDLRHAFGVRAYQTSRDLRAVATLMQHRSLTTTARYAEQAVSATAQAAIDGMQGGTSGGTGKRRARKQHARL